MTYLETLEHKLIEFGKYKLASGLIVKTKRTKLEKARGGARYTDRNKPSKHPSHHVTIKDPKAKTKITYDWTRGDKRSVGLRRFGPTWSNIEAKSKGVRMGKMAPKDALVKKRSARKIISTLGKHIAVTHKRKRPVRLRGNILNKKLAEALGRAYDNPKYKRSVGDIKIKRSYRKRDRLFAKKHPNKAYIGKNKRNYRPRKPEGAHQARDKASDHKRYHPKSRAANEYVSINRRASSMQPSDRTRIDEAAVKRKPVHPPNKITASSKVKKR